MRMCFLSLEHVSEDVNRVSALSDVALSTCRGVVNELTAERL